MVEMLGVIGALMRAGPLTPRDPRMFQMLTRRHFVVTSAMALAAAQGGPLLAQEVLTEASMVPEAPAITLPPITEGD